MCCNSRQANLVWRPSSLDINSFEKQSPGITPFVLNQNIEAKDEEKNIPSTAANAISRVANVDVRSSIHLMVQSALDLIAGTFSIALNKAVRSSQSCIRDDSNSEYVSAWIFLLNSVRI